MKALIEDMEAIGFNCAFRREEETKEVQFLVGLNDHDRILQEAEAQIVMVPRVYSDKNKQQSKEQRRER